MGASRPALPPPTLPPRVAPSRGHRIHRRGALGLLTALAAASTTPLADASRARALALRTMARSAQELVFGLPEAHESRWVDLGGRRRIVTFTRVLVEDRVAGSGVATLDVCTLGGRVDGVGQIAEGEAALRDGERCLLFLRIASGLDASVLRPIALSQGHYPMAHSILTASPQLRHLHLDPAPDAAVRLLPGKGHGPAVTLLRDALR